MGYIIKDTSALINTRITDVGRRDISQGNFNISYFSIGDSEVNYTAVPNYSQPRNNILMPAFNAQNDTGVPESNKENIKYPFYVEGITGNTYGIPFMDSQVQSVYNSQSPFGFFLSGNSYPYSAQTSSAYTITSNYVVELNTLSGQTDPVTITYDLSSPTTGTPSIGDIIVIYTDGNGFNTGEFTTCPVFTFQILDIDPATGTNTEPFWNLTLDRPVPNYTGTSAGLLGRVLIYPSGMTPFYDSVTPAPYWQDNTINYESPCDLINRPYTPIWNLNIPWSESPAGLFNSIYEDYTKYGSVTYIGTKEYLGTKKIVVRQIPVRFSTTTLSMKKLELNLRTKSLSELFTTPINQLIMFMVKNLQQFLLTHRIQQLKQGWRETLNLLCRHLCGTKPQVQQSVRRSILTLLVLNFVHLITSNLRLTLT
jgi:hypothetical protein